MSTYLYLAAFAKLVLFAQFRLCGTSVISYACSNAQKRETLGSLMRQYLKALGDTGAFPQLPDEAGSPEPQPQAKEWVLFYLAQHHDKLGETGASSVPALHMQNRSGRVLP